MIRVGRQGFSLVETLAVVLVISLMASLVVPRVVVGLRQRQFRISVQQLSSQAYRARALAQQSGRTQTLSFDAATQQLSISARPSQFGPRGDDSEAAPEQTENAVPAVSLPGWSVNQVNAPGDEDTGNELQVRFFPDGTSDAREAEFSAGGVTLTFRVTATGQISIRRGRAEEETIQEWEAGELERRTG